MGNRGELKPRHYETAQPFAKKPWIACVFKDKNGTPYPKLSELKYTKLFMLDEVTAFAAGHRPCGQCQKDVTFSSSKSGVRQTELTIRYLTSICTQNALMPLTVGLGPFISTDLANFPMA